MSESTSYWMPEPGILTINSTKGDANRNFNISTSSGITIRVKGDYNAKGDAFVRTDLSGTSGSPTVTIPTGGLTSALIGKAFGIRQGATDTGANGISETLVGTILAVPSATTLTLSANLGTSLVGPRTITDGVTTANSKAFTSATANFTKQDIDKVITIVGADIGGGDLVTEIESWNSSTSVNLVDAASTTTTARTVAIPGAWVQIGTDDTTAIQNAVNAGAAAGRPVEMEPGRYLTTSAIIWPSKGKIFGYGPGVSILSPVGKGYCAISAVGTLTSPLTDIGWQFIEIDGSGLCISTYSTPNKGLYCTYMLRAIVRGLYVHHTPATAIGNDFYQDSSIVDNVVFRGGRQVAQLGGSGGGSGIGVGTGAYYREAITCTGNTVRSCGFYGIFFETQFSNKLSRGIRCFGNFAYNCQIGFGDNANDGTQMYGNIAERCDTGIVVGRGFPTNTYSINTFINDNKIIDPVTYGITVDVGTGTHTVLNNEITNNLTSTGGVGIRFQLGNTASSPSLESLRCEGNKVYKMTKGVQVSTGTWGRVIIKDNQVWNCGISSSPANRRPAIEIAAAVVIGTSLDVERNKCYDTLASANKTQSYGFSCLSSSTVPRLVLRENDFSENKDGEMSITSTVTDYLPANKASNTTLTLTTPGAYRFTGTTATWTLPDLLQSQGKAFTLKNAGSGNLTVSAAGSDTIYDTSSGASVIIAAGATRTFFGAIGTWDAR